MQTWIIFWCYTFNYQDTSEQQLRVNQCIQVMMKIQKMLQNQFKVKEELLTNLVLTTVKFSNSKLTEQIYQKHFEFFGVMRNDFRIKEIIRAQKEQENQQVEKVNKAKKEMERKEAKQMRKEQRIKEKKELEKKQQEMQSPTNNPEQVINLATAFEESKEDEKEETKDMDSPRDKTVGTLPMERNTAEKILFDDYAKKLKQEELILYMGNYLYKLICYKMKMRSRTLLDAKNILHSVIKDDSVLIQLKEDCTSCQSQLLEPKLRKALQIAKLREDGEGELAESPRCTFCGKYIKIPILKITLGGFSHTWRSDRMPRHLESQEQFLSIEQIIQKTTKNMMTKRNKIIVKDYKKDSHFRHEHP